MQDIIHRIISKNHKLFGENPSVEKINIGFTNLVYRINDAYIVKIGTNLENEKNFQKEMEMPHTIILFKY